MLEIEVHPDPAMDENRKGHGPEGRGNRRLASKSTPIVQGQDFDSSTGTWDREEISRILESTMKIDGFRYSVGMFWADVRIKLPKIGFYALVHWRSV